MSEVFKAIETQKQFEEAIKTRLEREREKVKKEAEESYKNKYGDYDKLKSKLTEKETEITKLGNQLSEAKNAKTESESTIKELKDKVAKYETNSAKMRIAEEYGLDPKLADRLTGSTEEEMKEDAKRLKDVVGDIRWRKAPVKSNKQSVKEDKEAAIKGMIANMKGE